MLRSLNAVRYVLPLPEGGSLPAILEADDHALYVTKFRGAAQGPLALVAELLAGEIGRALGLSVPELVFMDVEAGLGRNEAHPDVRALLKASVGRNIALKYLPGSMMFDRAAHDTAAPELASLAVWFDAFVLNVDRTARNPNLLVWKGDLHFIDHGAALYVQHDWPSMPGKASAPFRQIKDHVLLPWSSEVSAAAAHAHSVLSRAVFATIVQAIPDTWLESSSAAVPPETMRQAYVEFLTERLASSHVFEQEVLDAHSELL